jgi:cephalosporin hydroxylase
MNPYQEHLNRHSDIREHLGLLHGLAKSCDQVVELGFRTGVSAAAFLAAGCKLHSVDIDDTCKMHVRHLAKIYPDTFVFKVADSRTCEIPECQMLFIDSSHTEATTLIELERHERFVKTWIVLHDTESFGRGDRKPGLGRGVMTAIETFLEMPGSFWALHLHLKNNNGLTILKRRCRR